MGQTKPSAKSNWTVGNASFATVTQEPSASKKQTGWNIDERPAREWMNWLFYITDQWVDYFEDPAGQIEEIDNTDSPYSATSLNRWLAVDTSGGAVTVNLPAVTGNEGVRFTIIKKTSDANAITIDGDGAETINGELTQSIAGQYETIVLKEANGEWVIESLSTGPGVTLAISASQSLTAVEQGKELLVDSSGGTITLTLPAPVNGATFKIKDSTGNFGTNPVTLARNGSEEIEGLAADYLLEADWGSWDLVSDGTNWFFV